VTTPARKARDKLMAEARDRMLANDRRLGCDCNYGPQGSEMEGTQMYVSATCPLHNWMLEKKPIDNSI
jgi:hypothetical protein